jgi:hypothetical protein
MSALVQADTWPRVRDAAASKGAAAEIAATARYLESLLQFAGSDCQRTSDAARALTILLDGEGTPFTHKHPSRVLDSQEASDMVSASLQALMTSLENAAIGKDASSSISAWESGSECDEDSQPLPSSPPGAQLPASSELASELRAAVQNYLRGSSTHSTSSRSSHNAQPLSGEQLSAAKPAQIVQAAAACEVDNSSFASGRYPLAAKGHVEWRGASSGDHFMARAQVQSCFLFNK